MSVSDDEEAARAEALLAAEAEEEAELELAMQLLRGDTMREEKIKPTAAAPPAAETEAAKVASSASEGAAGDASPPVLSSSSSSSGLSVASGVGSGDAASAATSSKPTGRVDRKKKSFSSGMDIDALMMPSSDDEDEKARKREKEERKAAKALEAAAAAAAKKKAAEAAAAAAAAATAAAAAAATPATPKRSPSQSPARRHHQSPAPRASLSATAPHSSPQLRMQVVHKSRSSRPVTGVSPSMHQTPTHGHATERRRRHASPPSSHPPPTTSSSRQTPAHEPRHRSPHSTSRSSAAHAALETRLRELEQHIHEQSLPHGSPARGVSSSLSPPSERGTTNQLKLRILELEKEQMAAQHAAEQYQRQIADAHAVLESKEAELSEVRRTTDARNSELRTSLSAQISELETKNYELTHELQSVKAQNIAHSSSYREMIAAGGKLPDADKLDPAELSRIQSELRSSDLLLTEMNKDNQKLHTELKICEAKYKNQIHQAIEEQKQLRFELQNKDAEVTRLTSAHNSLLDPSAKAQISDLNVAMSRMRDVHHHEVSNLKYELDKLRSVKVELAVRKEDESAMGRDALRLTLEALQEKYNALKTAKETEVRELHTKLVWYIENQQLITRYEEDLSRARTEIDHLRDENILMTHLIPAGTKLDASGKEVKMKARPVDAKKIKDLESKVAELSDIIRKKSSTPLAAHSGGASSIAGMLAAIKPTMEEHELIVQLRSQLSAAESALRQKDEETMSRLRSLRQETDQMKLLYEKRVTKLQKEVTETQKRIPLTGRNKMNRIAELERTVDELRRFYADKVKKQARLIGRVRRGENIDEREMHEAEKEAGDDDQAEAQQQSAQQEQPPQPQGSEHAPAVASPDSLPLPASRAAPHAPINDVDLPRSPLPAQVHPHPHPLAPSDSSTRDFLLFKQTLEERHDRDLHLITTRYEAQLEQAKMQWEGQVQIIRATHDADMKLQLSLLQQAQDEVARIRQSLAHEMQHRSQMQERCLQLESDLHQARNQAAYCHYKDLEHRIEAMTQAWQQREKEYADASAKSLADAHHERAQWDDQLRHHQNQLATAQTRFQQLTHALRQTQDQLQKQQATIARQQQQVQHQQKQIEEEHQFSHAEANGDHHATATEKSLGRTPLQPLTSNTSAHPLSAFTPAAPLIFPSTAASPSLPTSGPGFSTRVHAPEDLLNPHTTTPGSGHTNDENIEISWQFLMNR